MTMPNKTCPAVFCGLSDMGAKKRSQFGFHGLLDQVARARTKELGQRIGRKSGWIR